MRASGGRKPDTKKGHWDYEESLRRLQPASGRIRRRVESKLTKAQKEKMDRAIGRMDEEFITEKAEVIRDTLVEVQRNRKSTPNTLLQRNVWSSLDAIALHLDHSGFTRAFQGMARSVFKDIPLDDPDIVRLESQLMLDFLGVNKEEASELDLSPDELGELITFAEKEKHGSCGLPYITSRDFTFKAFFAKFRGRPDRILEIHHSPQAKATAAIITGVVNIVTLFNLWAITIVTVVILIILGCKGC